MARALLIPLVMLWTGCGDLEADRICLNNPCPKQTRACKDYVACYYVTGGVQGSLDATYGPGGTCWTTNAAVIDACTSACAAGVASMRTAFPDAGCK